MCCKKETRVQHRSIKGRNKKKGGYTTLTTAVQRAGIRGRKVGRREYDTGVHMAEEKEEGYTRGVQMAGTK